jgi:hypothetical protein
LIVPGDIEDGRINITLDGDDQLAINGALNWTANGVQSEQLDRDFQALVGMDRPDCKALLARIHAVHPDPRSKAVRFSQTELLAIQLAMALTADGPFAEDVHTIAGVDETTYRRSITALNAILQTWIGGTMRGASTSPFDESKLLALARSVAASTRDPTPSLIQHAAGTRERANHVMTGGDHFVPGQEKSILIAIRGHFSGTARRPPFPPTPPVPTTWSVQMLVVNAATGQVTDSGGSNDYPDLASLGPVITDYSAPQSAPTQSPGG